MPRQTKDPGNDDTDVPFVDENVPGMDRQGKVLQADRRTSGGLLDEPDVIVPEKPYRITYDPKGGR